MTKKAFNPNEFLNQDARPKKNDPSAPLALTSMLDQIETVTQRIESKGIDITAGYARWRDIGFALVDAIGESGRDYFHRVSRFYPTYSEKETDEQYDKCMGSHGTGITYKTFFQFAKESGVGISIPSKTSIPSRQKTDPKEALTEQGSSNGGSGGFEAIEGNEVLPTFSDRIRGKMPQIMEKVAKQSKSNEDADMLILGAMTVFSACMPNIWGEYARRTVYPNLFLFVTARPSSGKGRIGLCRYLAEPIDDQLQEEYRASLEDYQHKLAAYNSSKNKQYEDKPIEPPMQMLYIPANSSATAVYQVLNDNGGRGLMFESEGDTLANTFSADYGNYSDGFRKAFHHEPISYIRRKDHEHVNMKRPKLSTVLTGTPSQIMSLITDSENGLFSRFIFYYLSTTLEWDDVFDESDEEPIDNLFRRFGDEYYDFYKILNSMSQEIKFKLTKEQHDAFNASFEALQENYFKQFGDDIVPSIRRMGLVTFRFAMILTTLRMMDDGAFDQVMMCSNEDFETSMTMAEVLLVHTTTVFKILPKAPQALRIQKGEKTKVRQQFWDGLPDEFDTKQFLEISGSLGIAESTAERRINLWCREGKLFHLAHGRYSKQKNPP